MVRVRRTFIDGRYGQLHARTAGPQTPNKPAIVCLHMSPKSSQQYAVLMPHLADERRVIAPDYPGHGESDRPPAQPHVTVEDFAQSMWRVVDTLNATAANPAVHIVGHHTGSMVAVEAARQRPESVLSITNIGAPVFTAEEQARLNDTYAPIPIDEAGTRFRIMWERVLEHRGPGMTLQMAADSFAENLRAGDDYEWGHRAAFAYAPTYNQLLTEIQHPVFVLNPNDDCYEQSRRSDPLLKNGTRIDYPQWGHGFLSAYPAEVAGELFNFIDAVEAAA